MTTIADPDRIIIDRILSGDTRAFASIMERYAPRVHALVAGMTAGADDTADITQEIFIKVFSSLSKFRGTSSFSTWLFRISYNMAATRLRRTGHLSTATGDDQFWDNMADTIPDDPDSNTLPTVDQLYTAIDNLNPDEHTLISLFYLDGKSLAEIAFIMSITETNAKTRLFRIRRKLQKTITDELTRQ